MQRWGAARQRGSECTLSILIWNREETGLWAGSTTRPRAQPVGNELLEAFKSGTRYSLSEGLGSFIASTGHSVQNSRVQRGATPCPFTVSSLSGCTVSPGGGLRPGLAQRTLWGA